MQIIPKFRAGARLPKLTYAPSPNQSVRTARIDLIVIHDTEGAYGGSCSWLRNPKAAASAHLVLSENGKSATQLVRFSRKAWHAAAFNSRSIGIEHAGFAGRLDPDELRASARVTAALCKRYRIPVRLVKATGSFIEPGVTFHQYLGAAGGGHHDPGFTDREAALYIALVKAEMKRGGFPRLKKWGLS